MNINLLKTIAEILAYLSAAGFFFWKVKSGFLTTNMSISLKTNRSSAGDSTDFLAVAVTLKKGGTGTVAIHDARVRLIQGNSETELELIGFRRLTVRKGEQSRRRITFSALSTHAPFLFLSPDEETTFSALATVPSSLPCVVEAAVAGVRTWSRRIGQWKASVVSLPEDARSRS